MRASKSAIQRSQRASRPSNASNASKASNHSKHNTQGKPSRQSKTHMRSSEPSAKRAQQSSHHQIIETCTGRWQAVSGEAVNVYVHVYVYM